MTGAILQLVSIGQDNLYLTNNPSITMFKTVYRRYSNFSMQDITRKLGNLNTFGGSANYEIEKLGDLLHQMCLMIEIPPITLEFLSPTASNIAGIMNNYGIKWDYNSDGFQDNDIITIDYYNDNIIPDLIIPYINILISENNNANNILQIVDYTYGVLNSNNYNDIGSFSNAYNNVIDDINILISDNTTINEAITGGIFDNNAFYPYPNSDPPLPKYTTTTNYVNGRDLVGQNDPHNFMDVLFGITSYYYGGYEYLGKYNNIWLYNIQHELDSYMTNNGLDSNQLSIIKNVYLDFVRDIVYITDNLSNTNFTIDQLKHIHMIYQTTNYIFDMLLSDYPNALILITAIYPIYLNPGSQFSLPDINNFLNIGIPNFIILISKFSSIFSVNGDIGTIQNMIESYGNIPFFIKTQFTLLRNIINNLYINIINVWKAITDIETSVLEVLSIISTDLIGNLYSNNYSAVDNLLITIYNKFIIIQNRISDLNGWFDFGAPLFENGAGGFITRFAIDFSGILITSPGYTGRNNLPAAYYAQFFDPTFDKNNIDDWRSGYKTWESSSYGYNPNGGYYLYGKVYKGLTDEKITFINNIITNITSKLLPTKKASEAYQTIDFLRSIFENVNIMNDNCNYGQIGPYFQPTQVLYETADPEITRIGILYKALLAYSKDILSTDGTGLLNEPLYNSNSIQDLIYNQYINGIIKGIIYKRDNNDFPNYPQHTPTTPIPPYIYQLDPVFTNTNTIINEGKDIFYFDSTDEKNYSSLYDNMIFYHAINYGSYIVTDYLIGTSTLSYFNNILKSYYGYSPDTADTIPNSYITLDLYKIYITYINSLKGTVLEYLDTTNNLQIVQTNLLDIMLWNLEVNLTQLQTIMSYFINQKFTSETHFIIGYYKQYTLTNNQYIGTNTNIIQLLESTKAGLTDNISYIPITSYPDEPSYIKNYYSLNITSQIRTLSSNILDLFNDNGYKNYINNFTLWERLIINKPTMTTILNLVNAGLINIANTMIGTNISKIAVLNYIPILVVRDIPAMLVQAIENDTNLTTPQKQYILGYLDLRDTDQVSTDTFTTNYPPINPVSYSSFKTQIYSTILENVMFDSISSQTPKLIDGSYIKAAGNNFTSSNNYIILPLIRQEPLINTTPITLDNPMNSLSVLAEIENLLPINFAIETYRNKLYQILYSTQFTTTIINGGTGTILNTNINNITIQAYLKIIIQNVCNSFNTIKNSLISYNLYQNNGYSLYQQAGTGSIVSYSDAISSIWNNIYIDSILLYNNMFNIQILSNLSTSYYEKNLGSTMSKMFSLFQANTYNINQFQSHPYIYYGSYTNKYLNNITTNEIYISPINADGSSIYTSGQRPVTSGFDFYAMNAIDYQSYTNQPYSALVTTITNALNLFNNSSQNQLETIVGRYKNLSSILNIKYLSLDRSEYQYNSTANIVIKYLLELQSYIPISQPFRDEALKITGIYDDDPTTIIQNSTGTVRYIYDNCDTVYDIISGYLNNYPEPRTSIYDQLSIAHNSGLNLNPYKTETKYVLPYWRVYNNATNNNQIPVYEIPPNPPTTGPTFNIAGTYYPIYKYLGEWWENVIPSIDINTSYYELYQNYVNPFGDSLLLQDYYKSQISSITPNTLYNAPFLGDVYNNFSTKLDAINFAINMLIGKKYNSIDLSFLNERLADENYHNAYKNIINNFVDKVTINNNKINKIGAIKQDIIPTGPQGDDTFGTPDYRYPWLSLSNPILPNTINVIYLNSQLDTILRNMILKIIPQSAWAKELGHKIIKKLTLEIDGRELDEYNPDLLSLIHKIYDTPEHKSGYDKLIGNTPDMYTLSRTPKKGITLYIPLRFWFCKDEGNSLPICANLYSNININIQLNKLDELLYREPGSILISPKKIKQKVNKKSLLKIKSSLKMKYIYLDEDERIKYATSKLEYLINNFKYSGLYTYGYNQIINNPDVNQYLFFANPTKYLLWTIRAVNKSDPLSLDNIINWNRCGYVITNNNTLPNIGMTGKANIIDNEIVWKNNLPTTTNIKIVDKMKILFNGKDREEYHGDEFYKSIQPYARCLGSLDNGQYLYSFALLPQLIQPSGSANLTYVPQLELSFTVDSKFIQYMNTNKLELELQMWACSTEILRVMSGFIAPAFTY